MDCQPLDLSLLSDDDVPKIERKLRSRPCVALAKLVKTNELDEVGFREHVGRIGGYKALRLNSEEFEEFTRTMFGDFQIELGQDGFPLEFFHIYGAIADFVWYCLKTAHRKQAVISLLAAICMVANLIGRKLINSIGGRAVVYIGCMAASASGKNRPREVIRELYAAAGCPEYLLAEDLTGDTALADSLQAHPVGLALRDEFGKLLEVANSDKAPGPLKLLTALEMKLYTSPGVEEFPFKKFSDKRNDRIGRKVHYCVFGTGTPDDARHLRPESMKDGYNSRYIFYTETNPRPAHRKAEVVPIPDSLVTWAKEFSRYRPDDGELSWDLAAPDQRVVELTAEAELAWDRYRRRCDIYADALSEDEGASVPARAAERAGNFALILAASQHLPGDDFKIEKSHMDWAVALVDWLTTETMKTLQRAGETERVRLMQEIEDFVRSKGKAGAALSEITKRFHKKIAKRLREELIADLANSGRLVAIDASNGVGRPKQTFYHPDFAPIVSSPNDG